MQHHDLGGLEKDTKNEEIKAVVMQIPLEKVLRPNGYICAFYKICWDIIKVDLIAVIKENFDPWAGCWNLLNSTNVALIPKKNGAQTIGDYRPINIMHNTTKLLEKILSNQLAPYLDQLVSHSQSAFTKGRSIQDNFRYVLGAVNHFHHSETPMLLLKLDIVKDFDSVHWEYLLEIMEQLIFGQRWRHQNPHLEHNIIQNFAKWRSWMPNKTRTWPTIGDPLSPMLFLPAMDHQFQILDKATQAGLLNPVGADLVKMRTSLYTNDAIIFLWHVASDVANIQ
jgi:hypothetical protein